MPFKNIAFLFRPYQFCTLPLSDKRSMSEKYLLITIERLRLTVLFIFVNLPSFLSFLIDVTVKKILI